MPDSVDWTGEYKMFLSWRLTHLKMKEHQEGSDEDYWKKQWDHLRAAEAGKLSYTIPRSIILVGGMVFADMF